MTVPQPSALDASGRTRLEEIILDARACLEADLRGQASGRFGIDADGTIKDEVRGLDPTETSARRDLVEIVTHLRTLGESDVAAVARLVREAAFTHLNRLVAIRVAESAGLLPESLANGTQSDGYLQVAELSPLTHGYWAYLQLCADELAPDAPRLFDPRNPLLALDPSEDCQSALVAHFAVDADTPIWAASDTLGWAYQFFNTNDERREMRESGAPTTSRELAVRNQFFTPRYVVDFLVQNTLGRRLVESDPTTPLAEELPLLVDPPAEPGEPLDLASVKILDPACGSGHFLLGCYDLLERAWQLAGTSPADAAADIVAALHGVDIDPRCAQIASAAIMFRARRHNPDGHLPQPNIVTAQALPAGGSLPGDLEIDGPVRDLVQTIAGTLDTAPLLGVLLKAEELVEREVRGLHFGKEEGRFQLTDTAFAETESQLLGALAHLADSTTSTPADRLFAAEASDALGLLDICRTRYDVVLMNPPFGDPVPETKAYLKAAYPWRPTKDYNLLALFVGRGLELCRPDGYLGAITSRAGMFLTTFTKWREEVLLGNRLTALADLGFGVMEQALVEAAAYVVRPGKPAADQRATFIRLLKDTDRPDALTAAVTADRAGEDDPRVFHVALGDFDAVPGSPLAYWMSPSIRRLFTDLPPLEGNGAEVRQGLATGDDFRFVRAFWEVDPRRIARSREETFENKRWCPFAKGGEYSPYWADIHLVVDWERDGERIRAYDGSRPQNTQYYFRPGLTWLLRTNSALSLRVLPSGCIFSNKGNIVSTETPALHLGWLNTRVVRLLIDSVSATADETKTGGVPSRSYEVGLIQRLPSPTGIADDPAGVAADAISAAAGIASADAGDETARRFISPPTSHARGTLRERVLHAEVARLDTAVHVLDAYDRTDDDFAQILDGDPRSLAAVADAAGPLVTSFAAGPLEPDDAAQVRTLQGASIPEVVEAATARVGMARYVRLQHQVVDRRLETTALATGLHPRGIAEAVSTCGMLPPEQPHRSAQDLFSYLFGCAMGRWDVRIGRDPSLAPPLPEDLFAPVPLCPPGMLVGPDGFPAADAPEGYPLALPPNRILVDEPGHRWDVEAAVLAAAGVLFDDPDAIVAEMLEILGRRSVREYLRRDFFKSHLKRYSKSRRKAPIYWPLTLKKSPWGVWVYVPTLTRETLYAVAHEARRRERLAVEAVVRLEDEKAQGGVGRSVRKVTEDLHAEAKLAEEVRVFRAEAERVAELGWEPDADDGIILNAAVVADLVPAWKDAAAARKEIRAGKYPWATVSEFKDVL